LSNQDRCSAAVCDISDPNSPIPPTLLEAGGCDLALLLFCLSAIAPEKMPTVAQRIAQSMKPGGKLLFRDYGLYDHAQLRFGPGSKLDENFYVRGDGTRAYFFTLEELETLFGNAGFRILENDYILRQDVNRKTGFARHRVWIHAKFIKT
jgi:methyltransferase-like protein 6